MQKINIVTRPATYIFSFQGYSEDEDAFRTCLGDWLQSTTDSGVHMTLAHVPAVIASKGIAAVRNDNLTNIVGRRWPLMITFAEANQLGVLVRSILTRLKSSVSIAPHTEGLVPTLDRYFTEQRYTGRVLGWVDF